MSEATDQLSTSSSAVGVPGPPDPPLVVAVTHHSIELSWSPPDHGSGEGRLKYNVQEEAVQKGDGFGNVYNGFAIRHMFTGLDALTQYKYRVRAANNVGFGPWSELITVATTRQPRTCENLHKGINRGDLQIVKKILNENPHYIDVPDTFGSSPLMSACCQSKNDIVEVLMDMGAEVEYCNSSGKTSLMGACYYGNTKGAKLIVDRGASWKTRDHTGFSALHYAVDGGHVDTVRYVLSEGVQVDDVSESTLSGWTPLMRTATIGGNAEVAQVLIEAGADVNKMDKDRKTPLMLASLNGFTDLVETLLANGANPLTKNQQGKSAKDFAQSFHREEIFDLLDAKTQ